MRACPQHAAVGGAVADQACYGSVSGTQCDSTTVESVGGEVAKILGGLFGRNSTVQYRTQVNFSLLQDLFYTFFEYIGQSFHPIFDRSTIIPAAIDA